MRAWPNMGSHTSSAPRRGVPAYRAPEVVADPRRVSQKADVYIFGMLLLELLMEKAPTHAVLHDEGMDLPRWACSAVKEWTSEVFDMELLRHPVPEEEMVEMLRLAMDCTEPTPDQRPAMPEIVARIEASTACATPARDFSRSSPRPELAATGPLPGAEAAAALTSVKLVPSSFLR